MFRKNFKKIKTRIIFGTLLLSLFVAFIPSASAGIVNVDPLILVTYPIQEEYIAPNSGVLNIPLLTTFTLTGPFASIVERYSLLRNDNVQIELKVVQTQEWCTASISNPLVQFTPQQTEPYQSTLTVAVTEKAPAFTQGVVKISATSKLQRGLIFNIAEETVEFDVSFIIGYFSDILYEMPNGTIAEIGSLDTANFQIDIKNLGNGPTNVKIEILDNTGDKWDVNITSSVQLSSAVYGGEDSSKTVNLRIKPKISSNLDNLKESFRVKFTPSYLGRADLTGQEEIILFHVNLIGNLKEESDNNLLIIFIVAIILIILISIILKRKYS